MVRAPRDLAVTDYLVGSNLKSKKHYNVAYTKFLQVQQIADGVVPTEDDYLSYFASMHKAGLKGSTIWATYSKINYINKALHGDKLQKWPRITLLLKSFSKDERPKKSRMLSPECVEEFCTTEVQGERGNEAWYLVRKACAAIMFVGGLRASEAVELLITDVSVRDDCIDVDVTRSKTGGERHTFRIPNGPFCHIIKRYLYERQACILETPRLFVTGRKGNLVNSPLGINSVYRIPFNIASSLGLAEPKSYTGHCLRRSCAQHMVERNTHPTLLKTHFGWKSDTMVQHYTKQSEKTKNELAGVFTPVSSQQLVIKLEK